ncbi:MAG: GNAT family N-acetyltransferase [Elusimicrobia bacterium]|nr:GNAT family N-acetyltransferase [Elusimicrobiota bacterium]
MSVELLEAARDAARWDDALAALPQAARDVYFTSSYLALHDGWGGGSRALLFRYAAGGESWAHPFLLRPIPPIDGAPADDGLHDIESAYGYGGPLASTDDPAFLAEAHAAFDAWCRERRVVAEFVRLHPLLDNGRWLSPRAQVLEDRRTVSVDLAAFEGDAVPFQKAARNAAARAERAGVRARAGGSDADFALFEALYAETMRALGADAFYFFSASYFEGLRALLRRGGLLLLAEHEGECVAAATFLRGTGWLHYHLAGSRPGPRVPGAANLLILAAAREGRRLGLSRLHLGGGRSSAPDDALLKFKRSMGAGGHAFRIARRVHDAARYEGLRKAWLGRYPGLAGRYGGRLLCYRYRD